MPLLPNAQPMIVDQGPVGVLVLHGFTGQPHSVKPLANALVAAGHSVSVPRLPGHGTNWPEMNRTTWHDWYAEADRAFGALRAEHDAVFVMGLSMGGTLSLRLAELHGDAVAGLLLVNPSVYTTRLDRFALPVLRRVLGSFPGITNDIKKPGQDEQGYDKIPLNAASSLQDLWKTVRNDIGSVLSPIHILTSREDHVVEPENSAWILEHVASSDRRQEWLEDSYHVATMDNDAERIFAAAVEFIERLAPSS